MYTIKTLKCHYCNSVVVNLPETEIRKLDGLNFVCECCGRQNLLKNFSFTEGNNKDQTLNIFSIESIMPL